MPKRIEYEGQIHEFPDDFTDAEIAQALGGAAPSPAAAVNPELARLQGAAAPDELARIGQLGPVGRAIRQHPAQAGAMIGGALAVPLTGGASLAALPAMAAAGLGGAGGAGLGMLTSAVIDPEAHTPTTAKGVLGTMAREGAVQAAAEGTGRAIQGTLKRIAPRIYQSALMPTKAARLEHPEMMATGLEQGIPVSRGGLEKAGELVGVSKQGADTLVQQAASAPMPPMIDPTQAVSGITTAIKNTKDLPVARPQLRAIGDYARQYLAEHPGPMPLDKAQQAVRATDAFFNPAYRATMDRGNPITSGSTAAALGINDETRQLLRQAVPGLQAQNAQTSALEGLRQAIENRVGGLGNKSLIGMQHLINAGLGAGVGVTRGQDKGWETFALMEALTNPAISSRLAIGTQRASSLQYAHALRAALLGRLTEDQQKQTDDQH